jgi:1,2-phenylacetyl-CoA epoxidase catalytic subunit
VTKIASTKQQISAVTMEMMVKRLAKLWMQIDDMLRAMADVYVMHNKDMTKEEAYVNLKQRWLKRYLDM